MCTVEGALVDFLAHAGPSVLVSMYTEGSSRDQDAYQCFCPQCFRHADNGTIIMRYPVARTLYRHRGKGLSPLFGERTADGVATTVRNVIRLLEEAAAARGIHLFVDPDSGPVVLSPATQRALPRPTTQDPVPFMPETGAGDDFEVPFQGSTPPPPPPPPSPVAQEFSRFYQDPSLAEFLDRLKSAPLPSEAAMRALLPGNDGARVERLKTLSTAYLGDLEPAIKAFLQVITSASVKHKTTLAHTTSLLEGFSKLNTVAPTLAPLANALPTDAHTAFDLTIGGEELPLYVYVVCLGCGEVCRGEFAGACDCGGDAAAWDAPGKRTTTIRVFSLIDFLKAMFAVPAMAEAMSYVASEGFLGGTVNGHMVDYHGTPLYKDTVAADAVFNQDVRNVQVGLFVDGMRRSARDKSSGTVVVPLFKIFNLPPHLRSVLGFMLPMTVIAEKSGIPTIRGVLRIAADQLRFLRHHGFPVYDAHRQEEIILRGGLVCLMFDSREHRAVAGRAEAGSAVGSSVNFEEEGFTAPDYSKPAREDGTREKLKKVGYPEGWRFLPARFTSLRAALSRLNPRSVLRPGAQDLPASAPPPPKWKAVDIEDGNLLLSCDPGATRAQVKARRDAAAAVGVVAPNVFRLTGLDPVAGITYDLMHVLMNIFKSTRDIMMGNRLLTSPMFAGAVAYEYHVNDRFRGLYPVSRRPSDIKQRRLAAPFVYTAVENNLAWQRGLNALRHNLAHAEFKGANALEAWRPETHTRGPAFLKAAECHSLCGPVGKYLVAGLRCEPLEAVGVQEITYEEVVFTMLDALNALRRKTMTPEQANDTREAVAKAVALYEAAFPFYDQLHVLHQAICIAERLPAWTVSSWEGERVMRIIRALDTNPADIASTPMLSLQRFIGKFLLEMRKGSSLSVAVSAATQFLDVEDSVGDGEGGTLTLGAPNAEVYASGLVPSTVSLRGGQGEGTLSEDPHLTASLIVYYLTQLDWDEERAAVLHALVEAFVEDGGEHPATARGAEGKVAAWVDFRRWVIADASVAAVVARPWWGSRQQRALPAGTTELASIYTGYITYTRCDVGILRLRSEALDAAARTASVASYFLAKVADETGEWLELGRMQGVVCHVPPGPNDPSRSVTFLRTKWPIPTMPRLTARSHLPIVVQPTTAEAYLCDADMSDGFVTELWAAVDIEPVPVCVLPLDEAHDIPQGITVHSRALDPAFVRRGLRRYTSHSGGAAGVDPGARMDGSELKLAAVLLRDDAMADKFVRPDDAIAA